MKAKVQGFYPCLFTGYYYQIRSEEVRGEGWVGYGLDGLPISVPGQPPWFLWRNWRHSPNKHAILDIGSLLFFSFKMCRGEEELGSSLNLTRVVSWVWFWFQIYLWVLGSSLVCNTLNLTPLDLSLPMGDDEHLPTLVHMLLSWMDLVNECFDIPLDMVIYVMLCHDLPFCALNY